MNKWTRRAFLTTGIVAGGGLVVGVAVRPGNQVNKLSAKLGDEGGKLVHTYVRIDSDNVVTAIIPQSEMGQGVMTSLSQLLLEDLDAAWSQIREVKQSWADGARFGHQNTIGAISSSWAAPGWLSPSNGSEF